MCGYGVYRDANGNIYQGLFKNGCKHGTKVESYKNGGSYIGNFRDGKPEGHGKMTYKDGSKYEGERKNESNSCELLETELFLFLSFCLSETTFSIFPLSILKN